MKHNGVGVTNDKDYPNKKSGGGFKAVPRSAEYVQVTNDKDYGSSSKASTFKRPGEAHEYAQTTNSKNFPSGKLTQNKATYNVSGSSSAGPSIMVKPKAI